MYRRVVWAQAIGALPFSFARPPPQDAPIRQVSQSLQSPHPSPPWVAYARRTHAKRASRRSRRRTPRCRRSCVRPGCSSARRGSTSPSASRSRSASAVRSPAFVLLGDSWFQLLIAAVLGILFTQVAFLAHEAAHRTILTSGRANDRLGLILGNGIVGMSRDWWGSKHTRHHANPNRVGKDPDIEVDTIRFLEDDAEKVERADEPDHPPPGMAVLPAADARGPQPALPRVPPPPRLPPPRQGSLARARHLLVLRFALRAHARVPLPAARHGVRVHRRAAGRLRRLHGRLVRAEPQGHADHRRRREARLLHQAGAHLAQHLAADGGRPGSWAASTTRSSTTCSRACRARTSRRRARSCGLLRRRSTCPTPRRRC